MIMNNKLTGFRRLAAAGLMALLFSVEDSTAQDWIYTTVEGDNLWNLSEQHLDSVLRFEQLRKINGIENPKRMRPGTRLRVPLKWIRSNPVPATIAAVQGVAEVLRADGSVEQGVEPGTAVHLGDQLRTGADSTVAVKFADDSILTLHSGSLIRFDHLSAHGETGIVDSRLNLLEGRVDTRVTPAVGPGSRFEIQTPSAISAVRGTVYRASVRDSGEVSNIEVLGGKVAVSGDDTLVGDNSAVADKSAVGYKKTVNQALDSRYGKHKTLVKAGFGTQVAAGKPPLPPRKLLEPPQLNPLPERIRTVNGVLSWAPVPGASAYRVEVAAETTFNTLLREQVSQYTRAALPDLADGHYFVRLRAIDALGLEGKDGVHPILIDARPQPPVPLKPAEGHVLRGATPELQWTASSEADRYRLEISADAQFEQLLVDRDDLQETRFDSAALSEPGHYHWRLTSIAADGEHGPVSMERSYQIKPIPEQVEPAMAAADDGNLVASWRPGAAGQSYQVQLAEDPAFRQLVFDRLTAEPSVSFAAVKNQSRYLRVRAIEPDGFQGPWGAVQRVVPVIDTTPWKIFITALLTVLWL